MIALCIISEDVIYTNSETTHNYVDRVRLKETELPTGPAQIFDRPHIGSGWRQRSLSSIDISLNKKPHIIHPREQYTGLYDLYSRIEQKKDSENLYAVNLNRDLQTGATVTQHTEAVGDDHQIYDHPCIINFGGPNSEACSLRRTRSLAVIREETFNDLQITGVRNRRSQLIPRAKLVDRTFFKDRFSYKFEEGEDPKIYDSVHEIDGVTQQQTSEQDDEKSGEKSDLDSLDSNYFKNSLHQTITYDGTTDSSISSASDKTQPGITILADSTTSDSSDNYSTRREDSDSINEIKVLDEILLTQQYCHDNNLVTPDTSLTTITTDSSKTNTSKTTFDGDLIFSQTGTYESNGSQKLVIELNPSEIEKKSKDDLRSVISYDSIYLSSEAGSDHETGTEPKFEENITEIVIGCEPKKLEDDETNKLSIDSLYSEVTKPKVIKLEPKVKQLTSFSDYSVCGTLERLSFVSAGQYREITNNSLNHHQFYSLPDTKIGKSLIASERIDAKLREICETNHLAKEVDVDDKVDESTIYDSISRFGRAHKRLRQRENCEIVVLNSISIDEQPKEAPSIEIEPNIKEINSDKNKEYLNELGLDSDCGNSLDTFNSSDQDSLNNTVDPLSSVTVKLGGKKIIVDEIDAKDLNKINKHIEREVEKEEILANIVEVRHVIPEIKITGPPTDDECHIDTKSVKSDEISFNAITKLNSKKMSRPQILRVFDSKRPDFIESTTVHDGMVSCDGDDTDNQLQETEQEFHEKVGSVRCYWSKLADNEKQIENNDVKPIPNVVKNYVTVDEIVKNMTSKSDENTSNDFQSFCPSVEIIELNNQKQAAVMSSVQTKGDEEDDDVEEFDHIRYKVMKSEMFQKNLVTRNKKEAQFDGLIQYLQDYSFQELLAHNNVVIIEPVRTKIEKSTTEKPPKSHKQTCKITGGAGDAKPIDINKANLKRHFFYHPVRVNKELLDEELPNPDTVKNVRQLFENALKGNASLSCEQKSQTKCSTDNLRKKALRYLTIDTSFGNPNLKKWDSSSLSSGISSGDLSSPCECGELDRNHFTSEENLGDDFIESNYVSQDILEKIRECGSSVTYYGGQVVDNKSSSMSPVTKAIIQEIRGDGSTEDPNGDPDNYSGVKFKLVKSNSCSSRLELVGTTNHLKYDKLGEIVSANRSPSPEETAEESVRTLVNRLETGAINLSSTPRIIESKCIEKMTATPPNSSSSSTSSSTDNFTINNQLASGHIDLITQVTVNNHINLSNSIAHNTTSKPTTVTTLTMGDISCSNNSKKVCRNKNVDLAFINMQNGTPCTTKPVKDIENIVKQSVDSNSTNQFQTFEEAKEILTTAFENIKKSEERLRQENQQQIDAPEQKEQKYVRWETGQAAVKFDEKFYVANDTKLKVQKKYDEMEFEEFEVLDPKTGEMYDSLNESSK